MIKKGDNVMILTGSHKGTKGTVAKILRSENKVIVEIKSVEQVSRVHPKQLLTYLRITKLKLGLLINFNEVLIKNGITRVANGL